MGFVKVRVAEDTDDHNGRRVETGDIIIIPAKLCKANPSLFHLLEGSVEEDTSKPERGADATTEFYGATKDPKQKKPKSEEKAKDKPKEESPF